MVSALNKLNTGNPPGHTRRPVGLGFFVGRGDVRSTGSRVIRWLLTVGVTIAVLAGCESTNQGIVDQSGDPPYVRATTVDPDTVNLRSIPPVAGLYPVSVEVRAAVEYPDGSSGEITVFAELLPPSMSTPWQRIQLSDDGAGPDQTAGDGEFSGRLAFELAQSEAGPFRVRVRALDRTGFESNAREQTLLVVRENEVPLLTNLVAPDTVLLPPTGSTLVRMTADADDPDGSDDIQEVYFQSLDSSDPLRKFFLLDDGDSNGSGDAVAGDGTYSIIVQLPSTTTRKTYRFAFQAADTFGDTSATLLHNLTVR
jgi:hypothetical protein